MKVLINCVLLLFSYFMNASNLLVLPTRIIAYTLPYKMVDLKDQYKLQSLLLNIQKNGDRCFEFELADSSVGASFHKGHLAFCDRVALDNLYQRYPDIERPNLQEREFFHPRRSLVIKNLHLFYDRHYSEDFSFSHSARFKIEAFENINRQTNKGRKCYIVLHDYIDHIKELYFDKKSFTFYYLNSDGKIRYIDCMPLLLEYTELYQPIVAIKNASFFNVFIIFKNFAKCLKNYFVAAQNNQRLKNSLREVFFTNATKVFFHLGFVYGALLLFLWKKNISCKNIFFSQFFFVSASYILCNPALYLLKCIACKIVRKLLEMDYS